ERAERACTLCRLPVVTEPFHVRRDPALDLCPFEIAVSEQDQVFGAARERAVEHDGQDAGRKRFGPGDEILVVVELAILQDDPFLDHPASLVPRAMPGEVEDETIVR